MQRTYLSTYAIHIRELYSSVDEQIDNFDGSNDLANVVEQYLAARSRKPYRDDQVSRVLSVQTRTRAGRYLHGSVLSGDFGFGADICDSGDMKLRYKKRPEDVELIPLYFQFYVPKGRHTAYLVTQKLGLRSPYSALRVDLSSYFGAKFDTRKMHFATAVTNEMLKELLGGEALKIVLKSPTAPRDIADKMPDPRRARANISSSVVLDIKPDMRTQLKRIIQKLMDRDIPVNSIFEIDGFDFEDVQVKVDHPRYGGKSISRSKLLGFRSDVEITNRVSYGDEGLPDQDSVHTIAREVMDEIAKSG